MKQNSAHFWCVCVCVCVCVCLREGGEERPPRMEMYGTENYRCY